MQEREEKFYIGNDYNDYSSVIGSVISKIEMQNDMDQINIQGRQELVKQYVDAPAK